VPDPGDELVEIVDDNDRVVRVVSRREMRADRLRHRCTYVFVLDPSQRLYVHRRTDSKDVYPGYYDLTAGGVNAVGESYAAGAARELSEELGITAAPVHRFTRRYDGPEGPCFGGVFDVVWDGDIWWQPEEVAWGSFESIEEIDRMIQRERFCPDALEMYRWWRATRSAEP
jgi:8-oxo-dGTP pyrophosphatase MutT (NUDIX family)